MAALLVPGAAHASTIESSATTGPQSTAYIDYVAGRGERNRLHVHFNRDSSVTFTDGGVKRIEVLPGLGPDCKPRDRRRVVCTNGTDPIFVALGDRDDKVVFFPHATHRDTPPTDPLELAEDETYYSDDDDEGALDFTTDVDGGPGDDVIIGSTGSDYIFPGGGHDSVRGQNGADFIGLARDHERDDLRGGGGTDDLDYYGKAVRVDLRTGLVTAKGERDRIGGFELVHGTTHADTLLGSGHADALYGDGGSDTIDGRGGNDLLTADSLARRARTFANRIAGGPGRDLIDARGNKLVPANAIDCGPGADVVAGEPDDRLAPSCESAAFREPDSGALFGEDPFYRLPIAARPDAVDPDGTLSFRMRCPSGGARCKGRIDLSSPPGSPSVSYGRGAFDIAPGKGADVRVAGSSAAPRGELVAVHVSGEPGIDFGWQFAL
jgi:Ca2+-binding RTX toxin-like protein